MSKPAYSALGTVLHVPRWVALLCACVPLLAACQRRPAAEASPQPARQEVAQAPAFTILAGSELRELEPAIVAAGERVGLRVQLTYAGTLDGVDRINAGEVFDALLPPNGAYPMLALDTRPLARDKLFYSRVALGVKRSKAVSLGWDAKSPSWADIAHAAKAGEFRYAMTNPSSSNTGMSALFAVVAAAAKKTEDLNVADVNTGIIQDFLSGQALTAGSSGWLADAFRKDPGQVDGLVNYESVLLHLNEKLPAEANLLVVYPQDGVITADYPLLLLRAAASASYQKLVAALKSLEFQRDALQPMYLRPSHPEAPLAAALSADPVAELAFPARLEVIDAVVRAYLSEWRRPSTSIFVLDVSASMHGKRLEAMCDALKVLAGSQEPARSARYAGFQSRERVILFKFSDRVSEPETILFEPDALSEARARVRDYADGLKTGGQTAIFTALGSAIQLANLEVSNDPGRFVSIVLLTDGQDTSGQTYSEFRRQFQREFTGPTHARVFTIMFGEANTRQMQELAEWSGGRAFDARKASLASVFKDIRGYQ